MGIERVTIVFNDDDEPVSARITVKADGVMASCDDNSDTGFYEFWGKHLSDIVAKLHLDINDGAATGGVKENDG